MSMDESPWLRVGWFSTGRGPGSRALFRAICAAIDGGMPVELAYVFCNREPGEDAQTDRLFALVRERGVPLLTLSSAAFRKRAGGTIARKGEPLPQWRLDYDAAVLKLVEPRGAALGVLAGYMLIFGARACERLTLLNLHPAAPGGPIGMWQDVIWQLIAARAAQSGITIFRAIPEVDAGPPLSFCTYSLRGPDIDPLWAEAAGRTIEQLKAEAGEELPLFKEIRRRGAEREPVLIVETLRAVAERGLPSAGEVMDLTALVDARLAAQMPRRS
ncbi:MAG TPA: formyltransferase family protein [Dehalococcoidia bacterium]|jgi:folate-dependent phosphoribosylglycinamide formyltransferase PurN